ncbi:MAG: hypothetical protein JJ975_12710 [Bacteroidia bacterium]|nr:hypothetical protein [Bacteroidia bacterium]
MIKRSKWWALLRYLSWSIVFALIPSLYALIYWGEVSFQRFVNAELILSMFYLPGTLLAINYWRCDSKSSYRLTEGRLYKDGDKGEQFFEISDLRRITKVKFLGAFYSPWYDFHYWKFDLPNTETVKVSCLSSFGQDHFFDERVVVEKVIFPLMTR